MRSALIYNYGAVDEISIDEISIQPPKSNEVQVEVYSAGLNPKDILVRKGKFKKFTGSEFPLQMGYEFAGVINDSNGSELFHVGDHVYGMVNGWKGRCCAQYVNVLESELFYIPRNLSNEEACGLPLAGQTALQALRDIGKLKSDQKTLINGGSGGVGTLAIQIAKILGSQVTAVTSHRNIELCTSLGADAVVDYTAEDILKSEQKFNFFFDVFGNYSYGKVKHLLSERGIYVTTVPQREIFKEQIWNTFRSKKAKLVFVKSNSKDLKWILDKVEQGELRAVVDKAFSFEEIRDAHKHIETKRSKGKVVIKIK